MSFQSMFEGFKSMETFMRKCGNELKQFYHGRVIDIFTCDDRIIHESLPTLMAEYLFYYVVDSYQTATQILSGLNGANLPGEVNFFALNIINRCEFNKHDLISRLSFDAKFEKIFEKIFCDLPSNLDILTVNVSSNSMNAPNNSPDHATTDSGFTEKSGAIIGVKHNSAVNSLELYQAQQNLVDEKDATHYELSENSYRMDMNDEQLKNTSEWLQQQHQTMSKIQQLQLTVSKITQAFNQCDGRLQAKRNELRKFEAKVNELNENKNRYETEMKLDLLTDDERKAIELIQTAIIAKSVELQKVTTEMEKIQKRRATISDYYENSLMSRYSVLEEQTMMHSNNSAELNRRKEMLLQREEIKQQTEVELTAIQAQIAELYSEHETKKQSLAELEKEKLNVEEMQKSIHTKMCTMNVHKENLANELNRLRSQKPYDATQIHNPDIVDMSEEDINNQLSIAQHQLNTYANTENFDMNMLETFTKDRDNMVRRRAELSRLETKIKLFMKKIEADIKTSIRSTFEDLATRFANNFAHFVPGGAARLQLKETAPSLDASLSVEIGENVVGNVIGLDIFARFDEIEESFDNIFGQKRRLVALLFIISMQQLCPAPFYLFDSVEEVINCHINTYCINFV